MHVRGGKDGASCENDQIAFVDSLVDRFNAQYETQTSLAVEFNLGPEGIGDKVGD